MAVTDEKVKKIGLFDYVNDLSYNKDYLYDDYSHKEYLPFMINRAFAQHVDTILLANEMNKRPDISTLMHHDFMFYSVDSKKRYGKWAKANTENADIIEWLKHKYSVSETHAVQYMRCLSDEEIKQILKQSKMKGGLKK